MQKFLPFTISPAMGLVVCSVFLIVGLLLFFGTRPILLRLVGAFVAAAGFSSTLAWASLLT